MYLYLEILSCYNSHKLFQLCPFWHRWHWDIKVNMSWSVEFSRGCISGALICLSQILKVQCVKFSGVYWQNMARAEPKNGQTETQALDAAFHIFLRGSHPLKGLPKACHTAKN